MDRLKDLWSGQDLINRIILISGLLVAVWCIVMGVGLYGLVVVVIMAFLMISRANHLTRRRGRLYGTLYFTMPDGEIVPRTFEQVKTEYVHGAQSQYAGRKVFLCFPWWRITSDGQCDTGFGLFIRLRSNNELAAEAAALKRGEFVRVSGCIEQVNKGYFVIGQLEELKRITEEELYPLRSQFE